MKQKGLWFIALTALLLAVMLSAVVAQAAGPPAQGATPPQAEVMVSALNVREGPGTNFGIVDVARQGDKFDIIGTNSAQTWLQISRAGGSPAWISGWPDYTRV